MVLGSGAGEGLDPIDSLENKMRGGRWERGCRLSLRRLLGLFYVQDCSGCCGYGRDRASKELELELSNILLPYPLK